MRRRAFLSALGLVALSCSAAPSTNKPATAGVGAYLTALKNDDPSAAYGLLSSGARKHTNYREFAARWKDSAIERKLQIAALEEGLKSGQGLRERSTVGYRDGKRIGLQREGMAWRLASPLSSTHHAARPEDAVRMLADALQARDYERLLGALTTRRREGITRMMAGFMKNLGRRASEEVPATSGTRAELAWEEEGTRYKLILLREGDEWRVDDVQVELLQDK